MTQNLRLRGRSPGRIVNTAGQVVVHVSKNVLYYRFTSESLDSALTWKEEEDDIRQNATSIYSPDTNGRKSNCLVE